MGGNLISIIIIVVSAILIMLILKFFFMRFTKAGRELALKDNDRNQVHLKSFLNEMMEETNTINKDSSEILHKINSEIVKEEAIRHTTSDSMQFYCKFSIDEPFELLDASQSFLHLIGVESLDGVRKKYEIRNQLRELRKNGLQVSLSNSINLPDGDFGVKLEDIFKIDKAEYDKIVDILKESHEDRVIIKESSIEMQSDILNAYIKLIYNLFIEDKKMIVAFRIHKISAKVNPIVDNINTAMYKEVMTNLIVDLPFPFILVNSKGIKFLNKSACDWFAINYGLIDTLQKIGNKYIPLEDVFDKIDKKLTKLINDNIKNSSYEGFYKEYLFNSDKVNVENSLIKVSKMPKEIIVQGKPFLSINNCKELFITVQDAHAFHAYIMEQESSEPDDTKYIINKKNPALSEFIQDINNYNEIFKSFFFNTQNLSFGRVDIKSKHVIVSNDMFEELLRFDSQKERYINIVENILKSKQNTETDNNFYSYDIMFSDKIIKTIYTYHDGYADIVFIENYIQKYLSNNSIKVLSDMYEVSDLPISIVDRKAQILFDNKKFISLYNYDPKQIAKGKQYGSLLDLIPDSDKNKVKRAISDAVKFNSNNLQDDITLLGKDGEYHCKLLCIKTYGKIHTEEFITITIFPSDE